MTKKQIANGCQIITGNRTDGNRKVSLDMRVVMEFDDELVSVNYAKDEYIGLLKMIIADPEGFLVVKNA